MTHVHKDMRLKGSKGYLNEKCCPVNNHTHDDNAVVSKLVQLRGDTTDNKDTWHLTKNIARELRKITCGPRRLEGKQWHPELSDKAASIKTHLYWSMKNCKGDPDKLRSSIENIAAHYQDKHDGCPETSRCKTDPHYERSKFIIQ